MITWLVSDIPVDVVEFWIEELVLFCDKYDNNFLIVDISGRDIYLGII